MIETNRIICGDCVEEMKKMPDECIDLTVTSPPYDDLRTYEGYSLDIGEVIKQLYRITARGGVVVWIVNDATVNGSETGSSFRQALAFMDAGFRLHDTMIWEKDGFSFPHNNRYRSCFEYMFVFSKGKPNVVSLIADRKNKYAGSLIHGTSRGKDGITFRKSNDKKKTFSEFGVRFNVWKIATEKQNKTGHPAVFPFALARDHIISWSNPGDTVLDPFVGSGTTALAAKTLGRKYIGIDISEKYCEIAKERIG